MSLKDKVCDVIDCSSFAESNPYIRSEQNKTLLRGKNTLEITDAVTNTCLVKELIISNNLHRSLKAIKFRKKKKMRKERELYQ